jgi:hypothetical protein
MTLGQRETDNINPMITISKQNGYLHQLYKTDLGQVNPGKYNCNNQIITVITLSSFREKVQRILMSGDHIVR